MKKLLEKKSLLIEEMDGMLMKAKTEIRSFSDEEMVRYTELDKEVKSIIETISAIGKSKEITNEGEERMAQEERNYEVELREMTSTTGANAVPVNISDDIIRAVRERSQLIAAIPVVRAVGDMEFLMEQAETPASFLGELEAVAPADLKNFDKVKATDKRIGSLTLISKKLLNNSPAYSVEYLVSSVADKLVTGIEASLLKKGVRDEKELTNGIFSGDVITGAVSINDILKLVSSMKSVYSNGARFVMNRAMFQECFALVDGNGRPYMVNSVVNDRVVYKLLGIEVLVSEHAPDKHIALVNPSSAFKCKMGQPAQVQALQEKYAEVGQIGILVDEYLDVVCVDKNAIKILDATAA